MVSRFEQRLNKGCTGRKAEAKAGKRINARVNIGSGAIDGLKGDLTTNDFLIESKSTQKASLSIKHKWLQKIQKEALGVNKDPALLIQFTTSTGDIIKDGSWVMITENHWKQLMGDPDE